METVRRFQDWAGPAVWVMMLILAIGLCVKAGGFSFDHGIPQDVLLAKTEGRRRDRRAGLVGGADGGRRDVDHLFRGAVPQLLRLLALRARQGDGAQGQPLGPADQPRAVLARRRHHDDRRLQGLWRSAAASRPDLGEVRQLVPGAARRADLRGRDARHQRRRELRLAGVRLLERVPARDRLQEGRLHRGASSRSSSIRSRRGKATRRAFVGGIGATMGPLFGIIMVDYYLDREGRDRRRGALSRARRVPLPGRLERQRRSSPRRSARCSRASCRTSPACCPRGGASTAGSSASRSAAARTTSCRC